MAEAGRKGENVRSDCWIRFEPGGNGIKIELQSKVAALYGQNIKDQIYKDMQTFGINDGLVEIKDVGALPFVISARLETAVMRSGIEIKKSAIPSLTIQPQISDKDRIRRSRLYLPGNTPHLFINAGLHESDSIILDLEDSVSAEEKDAARILVRNALRVVNFYNAEKMVRINPLPVGLDDLDSIVPCFPNIIIIPKCSCAETVLTVDQKIKELIPNHRIWLVPVIESARGCFNVMNIAAASNNVAAISIGLEDYTADLGVQRTPDGKESFWARSMVVNAAKANAIQALDAVYSDVADLDGCRSSALEAKSLGYDGKACIHPRQVQIINQVFLPSADEVNKAREIINSYEKARAKGSGVIALDSKMIDAPVVKRALKTIELAKKFNLE